MVVGNDQQSFELMMTRQKHRYRQGRERHAPKTQKIKETGKKDENRKTKNNNTKKGDILATSPTHGLHMHHCNYKQYGLRCEPLSPFPLLCHT